MPDGPGAAVRAEAARAQVVGSFELRIGGMTCAACSARVERRLNRIEGVRATVNLATEKASVTVSGLVGPEELITAVRKIGYTAELPAADTVAVDSRAEPETPASAADALRVRLLVSLALSVPGGGVGDGAGGPVPALAVVVVDVGRAGGGVGGVAVFTGPRC